MLVYLFYALILQLNLKVKNKDGCYYRTKILLVLTSAITYRQTVKCGKETVLISL